MKKLLFAFAIIFAAAFWLLGIIARGQQPGPCVNINEFTIDGYPPLARQARVEGDVIASIQLRKDGTVASILSVTGPDLLKGSADAVRSWRFDVGDNSLRRVQITFRFKLSGPEDIRNVVARVKGKLPYLFEITTNPTSEKPGPNVGQ